MVATFTTDHYHLHRCKNCHYFDSVGCLLARPGHDTALPSQHCQAFADRLGQFTPDETSHPDRGTETTMLMQSARCPEAYGLSLADRDDRMIDRAAAGRELATLLQPYRGGRAIVLALPPGGVVVGGALARALRLPLDVLVAREFVIQPYPAIVAGALSEGGGLCVNAALLRLPGIPITGLWNQAWCAHREIEALITSYRTGRRLPSLGRRPVILVDDGLGNGLLQLAALAALRRYHAQRCIVATPYGTQSALGRVAHMADELVTLTQVTGERQDEVKHWQHGLDDDEAAAFLHRWQMPVVDYTIDGARSIALPRGEGMRGLAARVINH